MKSNPPPETQPVFPHPADLHDRLTRNPDAWRSCQFAGIQPGANELYELRNCPGCQSTLAKRVSRATAQQIMDDQEVLLARTRSVLS